MDHREFYNMADRMIKHFDTQGIAENAIIRTGISRAYYAAYHQGRKYFGIGRGESISHGKLMARIKAQGGEFVEVWNDLRTLLTMRLYADYFLDRAISEEDAVTCLDLSAEVIGKLDSTA